MAEAPDWSPGDWWEWEVRSRVKDGMRLKTVAASVEAGVAQIGGPDRSALLEVLPLHIVPMGAVGLSPLSWDIHGIHYGFIEFPLYDGKTWKGDVWFAEGIEFHAAEVLLPTVGGESPGFMVTALQADGSRALVANWSVAQDQFFSLQVYFGGSTPFSELTLVASGTDHPGPVYVPTFFDLYNSAGTGLTMASFEVSVKKHEVLLACFIGGAVGHYEATFENPNGDSVTCARTLATREAMHLQTILAPAKPGTWNGYLIRAGEGSLRVEVFAVHFDEIA